MKKQKIKFQNRIAILSISILCVVAILVVGGLVMSDMSSTNVMAAMSIAALPLFMIDGKFKELSKEDYDLFVKEAKPEELAGYLNALNAFRKNELKELIAKGEKENKEAIDKMKAEITDMRLKQVDVMEKALEKQGLTIQKLLDERKEKSDMSVIDQIKSELTKNKETLNALKSGKRVDFNFSFKTAATTILESTNLTGAIPQYMRIPGVNFIAQRMPFILDLIGRGTTTSNVIEWVEEVAGNGGAGYTTEGSKKNLIDATFILDNEKVQKLTVMVKISEEMLSDVDFMASYINNKLLNEKLQLKLDAELLSGAGGGSAINGIITQSTAWAAGVFAGTISDANIFDVLRTAINQVMVENFMPSVIVMHPTDVTKMKLTKNQQGTYMFPTFIMPGGTQEVDGIRIVTNTGMTAGKFLVMDGAKSTAYFKEGINIKAGWSDDDFEKNLRTIIAECRVANVIEGNDVKAFVYGDFDTAITALQST
jgi:HK97 family phage major capsid protein